VIDKCWTYGNNECLFAFRLSLNNADIPDYDETITERLRRNAFELCYNDLIAGYLGINKTIKLITRNYY